MYPGQPRPAAAPAPVPSGGPDGTQLTGRVNGHLDYLSQLSRQLGVTDPVETWLTPALGRWSDLHAEAGRWRAVANTVTEVGQALRGPLGGLDAAWQGADARSFVDYMQSFGLAGTDLSDAATAMADALDKTADGLRQIVSELVDLLAGTAEQASDALSAPVGGQDRAQQCLAELDEPTGALNQSVQAVLGAFVRLCDGLPAGSTAGITMAHTVPTANWTAPGTTAPSTAPVPAGRLPARSTPPAHPITVTVTEHPGAAGAPPAGSVPAQAAVAGPDPVFSGQLTPTPAHAGGAALPGGGGAGLPGGSASPGGGGLDVASGAQQPQHQQPAGPGAQSGVVPDAPAGDQFGAQPQHPAAAGGDQGAPQGSSMGGMGGMGGMRGGQGGGDQEHKSKYRLSSDTKDVFGRLGRSVPPVIGDEQQS